MVCLGLLFRSTPEGINKDTQIKLNPQLVPNHLVQDGGFLVVAVQATDSSISISDFVFLVRMIRILLAGGAEYADPVGKGWDPGECTGRRRELSGANSSAGQCFWTN